MNTFNFRNAILLSFLAAFIIFSNYSTTTAQEKFKVGGKMSATTMEKHEFPVGDVEGHIFHISKSEGINTSTGKDNIMDGALIDNNNFSDLIKGNGHHQGYVIFTKDGNTTEAKWEGDVTTNMANGKPFITFKGKFTYTRGTGKFKNMQGEGTYKGKYISPNTYLVDWEGEYFIKK